MLTKTLSDPDAESVQVNLNEAETKMTTRADVYDFHRLNSGVNSADVLSPMKKPSDTEELDLIVDFTADTKDAFFEMRHPMRQKLTKGEGTALSVNSVPDSENIPSWRCRN